MKNENEINICVVIGKPIKQSLSPLMHNSGYKTLGIGNQFVFMPVEVDSKDIAKFIDSVRLLGIRGVSCTMPHKITVMKFLDEIETAAKKIGAVNTIVNDGIKLKGFNTDYIGVLKALQQITTIKNRNIAVIGSGGAARAIIFACLSKGGKVTIFNRTFSRAKALAKEFGCSAKSFADLSDIKNVDIIISAIPQSAMQHPTEKFLQNHHTVFDIVYNPINTSLIRAAKEKGAKSIRGIDMFVEQGISQFELFTNKKAPKEIMRKIVLNQLKKQL